MFSSEIEEMLLKRLSEINYMLKSTDLTDEEIYDLCQERRGLIDDIEIASISMSQEQEIEIGLILSELDDLNC